MTTLEEASPSCWMPIPHSETRRPCTGKSPFHNTAAFPLPWDMMEGCCHRWDQQVSEEHFPCTQSCQQVSETNFHLLRPGCAACPQPHPGLSLAKPFPLRGAPHPLPAPRLPGSIHLISLPFFLPPLKDTLLTLPPPRALCSDVSPSLPSTWRSGSAAHRHHPQGARDSFAH